MKFRSEPQTFSAKYKFLQSSFDWLNSNNSNQFTIQSLVVSASFFNLKDDLLILQDLKSEYKDLGFEMLVQREIETDRVENELVHNYLQLEGKTKFFPPIVVALIPTYKILMDYKEEFVSHISLENDNVLLNIGNNAIHQAFLDVGEVFDNIHHLFDSQDVRYGELSWDKEKMHAIIIDGQHRFFALKKFIKDQQGIELSKCFFPLNFVVITPEKGQKLSVLNYIKLARELFIDINKNAKKVSHTRQILLDDIDLLMFLTRKSIKQYNITEEGEIIDWQVIEPYKFLSRIPQGVVNWNADLADRDRDNIKLLKLSQIISTSLLFKIIKDFIFVSNSADETKNIYLILFRVMEFNEWIPEEDSKDLANLNELRTKASNFKTTIEGLQQQIEDIRETEEDDADVQIENFEKRISVNNEKALSFEPELNGWLSNRFFNFSRYGQYLTLFFSQFYPYQKIIQEIEPFFEDGEEGDKQITDTLIDPDPKKTTKGSYGNEFSSDQIKEKFYNLYDRLESIKTKAEDVRYTVFQRAIFSEMPKTLEHIEMLFPDDEFKIAASKYIESISSLFHEKILQKEFSVKINPPLFESLGRDVLMTKEALLWNNIMINDSGNLKYRDTDAKKIGELLKLLIIAKCNSLSYMDLKKKYGQRFTTLCTPIKRYYKSYYEKVFKEKLELNSIREVQNNINTDDFTAELERIIEVTIDRYIN